MKTKSTTRQKPEKDESATSDHAPLVPVKKKRSKFMTTRKMRKLLERCDVVLNGLSKDLEEARELVEPVGLTVDSSILDIAFGSSGVVDNKGNTRAGSGGGGGGVDLVLKTTAGHSNTDHVVRVTGDARRDRLLEWKRAYQRRVRSMQPEATGDARWDKPKLPGERRRRIQRDQDSPRAPPEPPLSGYIIFIGQMTVKRRHDNPHEPHHQPTVVQDISKIWKDKMTNTDRQYYKDFASQAQIEYKKQLQEFKATGQYQPSEKFERMENGVGPWVKKSWNEKNGLERELSTYETVVFPARPPQLDEAYEQRRIEGIERRRAERRAKTQQGRQERERNETETVQQQQQQQQQATTSSVQSEQPNQDEGTCATTTNTEATIASVEASSEIAL